ncbi:cyclic pyranopterin monophosphate synthase, mitochondrial isoform X2 [Iris pallida]|uniref:cyclic pyranopterin monophosphate synthase n=1 Tax=Iris pallida TaxID=29817 RepID=A0AAX6F1L6_IRIPA|nr:cyclic pyranopterin monophosphate synthase, mitochondrial isoform X2 [Iris pallida]
MSAGPRYAPEDPTLPKPWRALVDGSTGFIYFWNPQTKVTTYIKPTSDDSPSVPKPKENQVQQQQQQQQQQQDRNAGAGVEDSRGSRQGHVPGFSNSKSLESSVTGGYESSRMHGSPQSTMETPRVYGKRDVGGRPAAEAYRRLHEITVTEMESIFGQPPVGGIDSTAAQEPYGGQEALSHVNTSGHAAMVDVSSKEDSKRVAVASCKVLLGEKAFNLVAANQISKGDVLTVAKIAGINGAKQTSNLIPLCHNIGLTHIRVDLTLNKEDLSVEIEGEAGTTGKTGVEMEAMTAVTVAGLTVYDMCKAESKDIRITDVHLEHKSGGKSGEWFRKH